MIASRLAELLVRHSSPTLAGIKTGSLFSLSQCFNDDLKEAIVQFNCSSKGKNICLIPVRSDQNRTLLYVYRPSFLKQDFRCAKCRNYLEKLGYPVEKAVACVREYIDRLSKSSEFLHEIGFFLGYPADDVIGFIEHGSKCAKCKSAWLVYSDIAGAKRKSRAYRTCQKIYMANWRQGKSIESLTVAV